MSILNPDNANVPSDPAVARILLYLLKSHDIACELCPFILFII